MIFIDFFLASQVRSNSANDGEDVARIFIEFPLWTSRALIEFMLIRVTSEFSARDNDRYSHAVRLFRARERGTALYFSSGTHALSIFS